VKHYVEKTLFMESTSSSSARADLKEGGKSELEIASKKT